MNKLVIKTDFRDLKIYVFVIKEYLQQKVLAFSL